MTYNVFSGTLNLTQLLNNSVSVLKTGLVLSGSSFYEGYILCTFKQSSVKSKCTNTRTNLFKCTEHDASDWHVNISYTT